MRYQFYTADVFTEHAFGGNPLAVFPRAHGLSPLHMQQIAQEFNLSETAFVLPPSNPANARRLRIFTPRIELPFAGHPTIGAAHVLATIGEIGLGGEQTSIVFEEHNGPVAVTIHAAGGRPAFAWLSLSTAPEYGPPAPMAGALAEMLSLQEADLLHGTYSPQAVSAGVPFLIIPVRDNDALRRARLDRGTWQRLLADFWAPHIFLFTWETSEPGADLQARMFAPAMGIEEDAATGAAAAAMAGYLGVRQQSGGNTYSWTIAQGIEMGRPSRLHVQAEKSDDRISRIHVGGASVLMCEGTIEIPDEQ